MADQGQERSLAYFRWRESRQRAIVQVLCIVVYYYVMKVRSQRRIVDRALTLEKDRIKRDIMKKLDTIEGRKITRMGPKTFLDLCALLEQQGGLRSTQRVSVEEQVVKTLYILTHNVRNEQIQFWLHRSGETISRHFHRVLSSIIELEELYLKQPDGSRIPIEIIGSNRFNPFFKDCIGAIDCTHVRAKVPLVEAPKYRGRKDFPTQNVLAACSFDLRFTYVLPGWEGTASDSRILKDALHRTNGLKIPRGKYYILDAGFMLRKGLITPYRSTRYHLKEFSATNPPRTPQELFNNRHSSLRKMSETKSETKRETWTADMDNALVEAFLHQQNEGNRVNGTFTTTAYEAIVKELQEKFERTFGKEKVKGRWKLLKRRFSKCYDLFKNGLSGFAWDLMTKRWCAEKEVWQQLIEKNPEAEEWMKKPIANYDKMMILCGKDRATGQHAETAKDIRNKRQLMGESESIGDGNQVTLESIQETDGGNEVTSPEVQGTRRQAKRSRKSKDEEEFEGIKVALQDLAGAIREGNVVYEKVKQKLPISEAEIWKLLEDLKIERHVFTRAYLYLLDNPDRIRAVIGCPPDKRKELLLEMVLENRR
ncbi:hypothetical protein OROGR_017232 [Orobanche gracilis]